MERGAALRDAGDPAHPAGAADRAGDGKVPGDRGAGGHGAAADPAVAADRRAARRPGPGAGDRRLPGVAADGGRLRRARPVPVVAHRQPDRRLHHHRRGGRRALPGRHAGSHRLRGGRRQPAAAARHRQPLRLDRARRPGSSRPGLLPVAHRRFPGRRRAGAGRQAVEPRRRDGALPPARAGCRRAGCRQPDPAQRVAGAVRAPARRSHGRPCLLPVAGDGLAAAGSARAARDPRLPERAHPSAAGAADSADRRPAGGVSHRRARHGHRRGDRPGRRPGGRGGGRAGLQRPAHALPGRGPFRAGHRQLLLRRGGQLRRPVRGAGVPGPDPHRPWPRRHHRGAPAQLRVRPDPRHQEGVVRVPERRLAVRGAARPRGAGAVRDAGHAAGGPGRAALGGVRGRRGAGRTVGRGAGVPGDRPRSGGGRRPPGAGRTVRLAADRGIAVLDGDLLLRPDPGVGRPDVHRPAGGRVQRRVGHRRGRGDAEARRSGVPAHRRRAPAARGAGAGSLREAAAAVRVLAAPAAAALRRLRRAAGGSEPGGGARAGRRAAGRGAAGAERPGAVRRRPVPDARRRPAGGRGQPPRRRRPAQRGHLAEPRRRGDGGAARCLRRERRSPRGHGPTERVVPDHHTERFDPADPPDRLPVLRGRAPGRHVAHPSDHVLAGGGDPQLGVAAGRGRRAGRRPAGGGAAAFDRRGMDHGGAGLAAGLRALSGHRLRARRRPPGVAVGRGGHRSLPQCVRGVRSTAGRRDGRRS